VTEIEPVLASRSLLASGKFESWNTFRVLQCVEVICQCCGHQGASGAHVLFPQPHCSLLRCAIFLHCKLQPPTSKRWLMLMALMNCSH